MPCQLTRAIHQICAWPIAICRSVSLPGATRVALRRGVIDPQSRTAQPTPRCPRLQSNSSAVARSDACCHSPHAIHFLIAAPHQFCRRRLSLPEAIVSMAHHPCYAHQSRGVRPHRDCLGHSAALLRANESLRGHRRVEYLTTYATPLRIVPVYTTRRQR